MKRLVQRLINVYKSRPDSTSPDRCKWDESNIAPAKADLLRFADKAFLLKHLKVMKKGFTHQMSEKLAMIKMYEAQLELMRVNMPELFEHEPFDLSSASAKVVILELEDLLERANGMIAVLETAIMIGTINTNPDIDDE